MVEVVLDAERALPLNFDRVLECLEAATLLGFMRIVESLRVTPVRGG